MGGIFDDVVILGAIKRDLKVVFDRLPDYNKVVGVARTNTYSRSEPVAINQFNKGKINRNGAEDLALSLDWSFPAAKRPTKTFCNYAAYMVQQYIESSGLSIKHSFVHINDRDLSKLDYSHIVTTAAE